MTFKQKLTLLFAFCLLLLGATSTTSHASEQTLLNSAAVKKIKKSGVLKVGVKQDVPNFGYYSAKTKSYEGMEIDIARKIAKSLNVKPVFTAVTAQTREAVMDNGQVDMVIATYTITPERQKSYAFSNAYYTDEIGF